MRACTAAARKLIPVSSATPEWQRLLGRAEFDGLAGGGAEALALVLLLGRGSPAAALTWEVVAAHGVGDGGPALSAPIGSPQAIAVDSDGKLYIADPRHARIRVVADGEISTIAGTGATGYNGDGIAATAARINYPSGIAVAADGTVYFIDQSNHRLRAVGPGGVVRTVAGDGRQAFSGDSDPANAARLSGATGIAVDSGGNVYIADTGNHRVLGVAPDGSLSTVAGTGEAGHSGDGGPALQARLRYPKLVAIDGQGALYFYDSGNRVVRHVDADGRIWSTGIEGLIDGLAAGSDGTLYYSHHTSVWRSREGQTEAVIGAVGNDAETVGLEKPIAQAGSLAMDAAGNLFVVDVERAVVVRIDSAGGVSRVAGNGTPARYGDGGPAIGAGFACGTLVVDEDGAVFFTDVANDRIAVVRPDGRIETYGGSAAPPMSGPAGLAMAADGSLYVSDFGHNRVLWLPAAGGFEVVAGTGEQGFSGDGGPGALAALDGPGGLALDGEGRLYVADSRNMRIRRVDTDGRIATIAGDGEDGEPLDGAPAAGSPLGRPGALLATRDGALLVTVDSGEAVRRITPDGEVHTHLPEVMAAPALHVASRLGKELALDTRAGAHSLRLDPTVIEAVAADFSVAPERRRLAGVAFDPRGEWVYACDAENRGILRARVEGSE